MNCKKCNSEVPNNAKFCPNCGEKVDQEDLKENNKTEKEKDSSDNSSNESTKPTKKTKTTKKTEQPEITESNEQTETTESTETTEQIESTEPSKPTTPTESTEQKNTEIDFISKLKEHKILLIVAIVVLILLMIGLRISFNAGKKLLSNNNNNNNSYNTNKKNQYSFKWEDIVLGKVIPETESTVGEISTNSEKSLSMTISNTDITQFKAYVDKCKAKGFIVETEYTNNNFKAYDSKGYKLELIYTESEKEMSIALDAPKEYGTFEWAENEYTALLPKPESNIGEIIKNDEKGFILYVAKINIDKFKEYKNLCKDKGFKTNPFENEKNYSASNEEGYKLQLNYEGNSVVRIDISEPEFNVDFEIKCVENLIFSKYDVKIYIDNSSQGTLKHGASQTYTKKIKRGVHKIKAVSVEDSSVKGEATINIPKASNVKVEINCTSSEAKVKITNEGDIDTKMLNMIDVKGLAADEAKDKLTELGFTNIKSNTSDGSGILFSDLYQVINQNIEPNTEIISNTEIVLTCKSKSEIETEEKAKAAAQAIPAQITTQESTPKDQYDSTDYKIDAKYAFEEDIEDQCPFGVKFHWILGNIAQRYEGNGEWFFKVEVTITNAFGAEYDTIAEGRVDVTNGCNVTYSYIYPR